ncbi:MAG: cytochrome c [Syntrophobacterales bacterium]|nr:cytochrome c [Syntrophobacterales bacterium]
MTLLGLAFLVAVAWGQTPNDLFPQGKGVFEDNCAQCHRANGQGLPGTFPALDADLFVAGKPQAVIATVLNGRKGHLGRMPAWKDKLDDRQIAAVVTYIRHAWSNRAPAVTPAMVGAIRGK